MHETQWECCALLFDLDGVLIDSTPAVARVWSRWAKEHGFDPAEVVERAHGRPSLTTIREYLPNADHEAENRKVEHAEIEDLEGVVPLPGALELLAAIPENRWTIVTSCTRALAEVRIRAAGLPVPKRFVTSTDITQRKAASGAVFEGRGSFGVSCGGMRSVRGCASGNSRGQGGRSQSGRFPNDRGRFRIARSRGGLDCRQCM